MRCFMFAHVRSVRTTRLAALLALETSRLANGNAAFLKIQVLVWLVVDDGSAKPELDLAEAIQPDTPLLSLSFYLSLSLACSVRDPAAQRSEAGTQLAVCVYVGLSLASVEVAQDSRAEIPGSCATAIQLDTEQLVNWCVVAGRELRRATELALISALVSRTRTLPCLLAPGNKSAQIVPSTRRPIARKDQIHGEMAVREAAMQANALLLPWCFARR